ncbi:ankyrin repeat domain-containing protein [Shimazuella kribbensis]|uniref:ankyrin repeat domain-containing protein n=1 Tax=Shimazuella kribbensis TaxID=139808 RepID=UPI0004260758|nr:ankyrin repeat domain-containing protein [Shimazuella kribbensis]
MNSIRFIRHIDKKDKEFWETCNLVRYDKLEEVTERLRIFPAHLNQKTANGTTLLYFSQSEQMTSYLINQGLSVHEVDEWGNTPLHLAAYEGFTEAVSVYLQNRADVEAKNRWGQKPHQLASTPATCDLFYKNRQVARKYLEEELENISLYDACKQGKEAAVRYMLSSGVDPNLLNHEDFQVDYWEQTPLYHAIYIGYHRIVDLLLQRGANPNVHSGVSLYRSAYNVATIQALHKYGAKATEDQLDQACWEAVVNIGNSTMLKELISYGAPLNKDYIIHDAIRRVDQTTDEYPKIIKILVEKRPEFLDSISRIDETPLLKAIDLDNQLIVECLVTLGADINKSNKKNITPALHASTRRNVQMTKWLIEHGADLTSKNDVGLSPYTWAVFHEMPKTLDTMETALKETGTPIPSVSLPPKTGNFEKNTHHDTHFFYDTDTWDLRYTWTQDRFLKFAYQLGFQHRFMAKHTVPSEQIKYFSFDEKLTLEKISHEEDQDITQYLAFHPEYPDAWFTCVEWWVEDPNLEDEIKYTQVHFRCPNELLEKINNLVQEEKLTSFSLGNSENEYLVEQLFTYSKSLLQTGLDALWQKPFYATKTE